MNPITGLAQYLDRLEKRLRLFAWTRGAAATVGACGTGEAAPGTTTGDCGIAKPPAVVRGASKSGLAGMGRLSRLDVSRIKREFLESERLQQIDVLHDLAVWNALIGR